MKSLVSSLSLVVVCSLVLGCGGGDGAPGPDAGELGPAPTLSYPSHAYTFLSPGNAIPPIIATATADGRKTFTVEGELPGGLDIDAATGTISGHIGELFDRPPSGTVEVLVTLTDRADREAEWPIAFTFVDTGADLHMVSIDNACDGVCGRPEPELLEGVHVGDFIYFSATSGSDEVYVEVDGAASLVFGSAEPFAYLGINSGAGTTIGFTSKGSGPKIWQGGIQVVE